MATKQGNDPTSIAGDIVEAFNRGDWERLRDRVTSDVVYEETGTGRRIEGADAYVKLCMGWKETFADVAGTVRSTAASGNTVALEITWEGTHTGPLVLSQRLDVRSVGIYPSPLAKRSSRSRTARAISPRSTGFSLLSWSISQASSSSSVKALGTRTCGLVSINHVASRRHHSLSDSLSPLGWRPIAYSKCSASNSTFFSVAI